MPPNQPPLSPGFAAGVPPHGLCWFPQLDSIDWDSLLSLSLRRADPVGVWSVTADGRRRPSVFTRTSRAVVNDCHAGLLLPAPLQHTARGLRAPDAPPVVAGPRPPQPGSASHPADEHSTVRAHER